MAELVILVVFAIGLLACALAGCSLVPALVVALAVFLAHGVWRGVPLPDLVRGALGSVKDASSILVAFVFIGCITATWRAGGTITYIICNCAGVFPPAFMAVGTFLLCSLVSFLMGTAFGTAATMGVICVTMCSVLGVSPVLAGGAALSGCYFGDRCSPLSTSALLVAQQTGTTVVENIPGMVKTSLGGFFLTCGLYLVAGLWGNVGEAALDTSLLSGLAESFVMSPWTLAPAVLALVLSALRVDTRLTLALSALAAAVVAVAVQGMPVDQLLLAVVYGYEPTTQAASLLAGGGLVSMVNVTLIVMVSSSYAGIFRLTGFLDGVQNWLRDLAARASVFGAYFVASVLSSVVACNQTLAIMLTWQLCGNLGVEGRQAALHQENTVVLIAPLVPWSIACAVPLYSMGVPAAAVLAASYLYLVPLWNLAAEIWRSRGKAAQSN